MRLASGAKIRAQSTAGATITGFEGYDGYLAEGSSLTDIEFQGIIFNAAGNTQSAVISMRSPASAKSRDVLIADCTFVNFYARNNTIAIDLENVVNLVVRDCSFENGGVGVRIQGASQNCQVLNTSSTQLSNHSIRFAGTATEVASDILLDGNTMVNSVDATAFIDATTSGTGKFRNMVVSNNRAEGRYLAFGSGGNGDLLSIKDTQNLDCFNNVILGAGDNGIAIVRCIDSVIRNNTASFHDTNGIDIFECNNVVVRDNLCQDNRQDRDGKYYILRGYGGVRVEKRSQNITVENNDCSCTEFPPKQDFGVCIFDDAGTRNNIVNANKTNNNKWGSYYMPNPNENTLPPTITDPSYSPDLGGFAPVGTRAVIDNGVFGTRTATVVANSESRLRDPSNAGSNTVVIKTRDAIANATVGVELVDGSVHWTRVTGTSNFTITIADPLPLACGINGGVRFCLWQ